MTHYSIELLRDGVSVQLGTARDMENVLGWFEGAFRHGLLPDPPRYTDEIQVWEVDLSLEPERELRYVWRLTWHQFEAKGVQ